MSDVRIIESNRSFDLKRFFLRWEWMLVGLIIVINVYNTFMAPGYWSEGLINYGLRDFMDKAILVFPMMLESFWVRLMYQLHLQWLFLQ